MGGRTRNEEGEAGVCAKLQKRGGVAPNYSGEGYANYHLHILFDIEKTTGTCPDRGYLSLDHPCIL